MTTTIDRPPARTKIKKPRKRPAGAPGRPRMDPRLRERRTAVLRQQGRHRLRVLLLVVSLPLVALLAVLALRSSWLSVHTVRVSGARQTPTAAVERSVAGVLRHPMASLNMGALEADVDRLPWVAEATITRSWPTTLMVSIRERTPVGSVAVGSTWAELDASGRVLAVIGSSPSGLPKLEGAVAPGLRAGATVGAQLQAELVVAAAIPVSLRPEVSGVGPEPDGGVQLTLAQPPGAKVEIGVPQQLGAKMSSLQTVLAQVDLTGVTAIDVRVPGQPALTRT